MKFPLFALLASALTAVTALAAPKPLFDGKSLKGWDGDTTNTFRVKDGMIMGGTFARTQPRNEFLATKASYTNFVLRLKFKLTGTNGFVNSGVQFRSQRIPNDSEMTGYQADIGEGWYGSLYDESRRNKLMAKADEAVVKKAVKVGGWNDYELRCVGPHIVLKINGATTVDYTEADEKIPQFGHLGLQVHGGGVTEVFFKDLMLEELP
ncbi:MAG TPA: DUF1080 domain-containing protein [Candidatus Limnocylindria bacterium]|nr:DUF1080 domain-containing protein [Candidatus Limnocylindria bacterium]